MSIQKQNMKLEFIEPSQVCNELGISESTLSKWIKAGKFPAPMRLGIRKNVWLKKTIVEYIETQERLTKESQL